MEIRVQNKVRLGQQCVARWVESELKKERKGKERKGKETPTPYLIRDPIDCRPL